MCFECTSMVSVQTVYTVLWKSNCPLPDYFFSMFATLKFFRSSNNFWYKAKISLANLKKCSFTWRKLTQKSWRSSWCFLANVSWAFVGFFHQEWFIHGCHFCQVPFLLLNSDLNWSKWCLQFFRSSAFLWDLLDESLMRSNFGHTWDDSPLLQIFSLWG